MKKKLVLMMSALMTIGLLAGCGSKHSHEWGDVSYTWAEDNSTCTATRVCKGNKSHVETETVNTTSVVVTEAKCEEDGLKRYTADFKTNEAFLDQTKDVTLEAIGHDLTHHGAKAATRLEDGNIEYWNCERCGKFYSDAEGTNEIDAQSVIIPALGTDKSYFVGTRWNGNGLKYTLYLDNYTTYYDSSAKINYRYDDFNYDDDKKELSFTISKIENYNIYTPKYNVGDVLTFTYNAKEDVLTFEGMTFVKSSF